MHYDYVHVQQRSAVRPLAVVCLCAIVLSACASDEKTISWEQDKPQFQHGIETVQHEQQVTADKLRKQTATIEELQQKVESLQQINLQQVESIALLANHVEELHRVKKVKARKKAPIIAVTPPKAKVTIKHPTPIIKPVVKAAAPAPAVPKVDLAAQAEAEKNAYTAAYLALKSGRFDEASTAFNKQLDLYPNGEYADQAWYWLGETRFAQGNNTKAHNAFKYVADHYANSVKHAAALLKLGQLAQNQKNYSEARTYYQRLIQSHADSSLTEQARAALSNLPTKPQTSMESQQ